MTLDAFAAIGCQDKTPGPGAYDIDAHRGFGSRKPKPRAGGPPPQSSKAGPSLTHLTQEIDYAPPRSELSTMRKSIGVKLPIKERDVADIRGPDYMPEPDSRALKVSIHLRPVVKGLAETPGPGAYTVSYGGPRPLPPMHSRPSTLMTNMSWTPSPAAYVLGTTVGGGRKVLIRPRLDDLRTGEMNPGFAYCNPDSTLRLSTQPSPGMKGGRKSLLITGDPTPGPAAYGKVEDGAGGSARMGVRIRSRLANLQEPQQGGHDAELYDVREKLGTRGGTIGVKTGWGTEPPVDRSVPGPDYVPRDSLRPASIHLIHADVSSGAAGPGPASYDLELVRPRPRPFVFKGPEERMVLGNDDVPGPGAYNTGSVRGPSRGWVIGKRRPASRGG